MLAVLLESRARKQRRAGGAALSVAAHLAIIGGVIAVTAHGAAPPRPPERPVWVNVVPPRDARPAVRRVVEDVPPMPRPGAVVIPKVDIVIEAPAIGINLNPKVGDLSWSSNPTCVDCRTGMRGLAADPLSEARGGSESTNWQGSELLMRIDTPAVPRYPQSLRDAGIEGTVLMQFAVDTLGHVDMASVKALSSTHALFTDAVRDALTRFRFHPAEVGGRHVAALAQMPFEFRLRQ